MGLTKRWIALVAVMTGLLGVLAPPVVGRQQSGPVAVAAFGANGGTESANLRLPGNGTGQISTSDLPKNVTKASVELDPQGVGAAFNNLVVGVVKDFPSLGKLSKRSQRIVACAFLSVAAVGLTRIRTDNQLSEVAASNIYLAALGECLLLVQTLPAAKDARAPRGAACPGVDKSIPVRVIRTRSSYRLQPTAAPATPSSLGAVIVSCRRKGKGLLLEIRPRRRGRTLRQVLGPRLSIGLANPTNQPAGVHASLKVN